MTWEPLWLTIAIMLACALVFGVIAYVLWIALWLPEVDE